MRDGTGSIGYLWLVFVVYWALEALRNKRTKEREPILSELPRNILLVGGAVLVFSRVRLGGLDDRFLGRGDATEGAGWAIAVAGLALAVWARRVLGRNWSGRVVLKEDHELIRSGPYAAVRHPIYTGLLVAVLGTALDIARWRDVVALALFTVSLRLKAGREEKLMERAFGERYRDYRRTTGMLLPRPGYVTRYFR
jgi:protein-S-isoprenylcysteine O-methyltransferase Ste14